MLLRPLLLLQHGRPQARKGSSWTAGRNDFSSSRLRVLKRPPKIRLADIADAAKMTYSIRFLGLREDSADFIRGQVLG